MIRKCIGSLVTTTYKNLPPCTVACMHNLAMASHQPQHFLVVTLGIKGHFNPALHLARRLTRSPFHIRVTVATPSSSGINQDVEEDGDLLSYSHYSDGNEDGSARTSEPSDMNARFKESITQLVLDLSAHGRPVSCIVYTILLTVAAEVANQLGIPSTLLWVQPAALFTIYHRYFHGYGELIAPHDGDPMFPVKFPGLPSLKVCDLPTFLTTHRQESNPYSFVYPIFEDMFRTLDRVSTRSEYKYPVLVNTFEELEPNLVSGLGGMELIPIGPLASISESHIDEKYIDWLDSMEERSVVYVAFGSIAKLSRRQITEISRGLVETGRPYLWVLRKDGKEGEEDLGLEEEGEMGMVVEWCSQIRVLAHPSIGCFVTHCGWNSTLEGLVCGVPLVMVPQWADQPTNARLAEGEWGIGVRAVGNGDEEGVVEGRELRRCVDVVMEEGGEEMRRKATMWEKIGKEAIGEGGSSFQNLKAFVGIRGWKLG